MNWLKKLKKVFFNKTKTTKRAFARPTLETLEDRAVPTAVSFTYYGGGTDNKWENPANWSNDGGLTGSTAYPGGGGRTTDTAYLNGADDNVSIVESAGITLKELDIFNGWTSTLNMQGGPINVNGGQMTSNATILQNGVSSCDFDVQSGTFLWSQGNIESASTLTTHNLHVSSGATLKYVGAASNMGDSLVIDRVGELLMPNSSTMTLVGKGGINNSGLIDIDGAGNIASTEPLGQATIWNGASGTIQKSKDLGNTAIFECGITNYGDITVAGGETLEVNGPVGVNSYSIINESSGITELQDSAVLVSNYGYTNYGVLLCDGNGFDCTLSSTGAFNMYTGATMKLGGISGLGGYGTFFMSGFTDLNISGGTLSFGYNSTADRMSNISSDAGDITIGTNASVNYVLTSGSTSPKDNYYDIVQSTGLATIGAVSDPAPTGWTGSVVNSGKTYRITKN